MTTKPDSPPDHAVLERLKSSAVWQQAEAELRAEVIAKRRDFAGLRQEFIAMRERDMASLVRAERAAVALVAKLAGELEQARAALWAAERESSSEALRFGRILAHVEGELRETASPAIGEFVRRLDALTEEARSGLWWRDEAPLGHAGFSTGWARRTSNRAELTAAIDALLQLRAEASALALEDLEDQALEARLARIWRRAESAIQAVPHQPEPGWLERVIRRELEDMAARERAEEQERLDRRAPVSVVGG